MKSCHPDLCPGVARLLFAFSFDGYFVFKDTTLCCAPKRIFDAAAAFKLRGQRFRKAKAVEPVGESERHS